MDERRPRPGRGSTGWTGGSAVPGVGTDPTMSRLARVAVVVCVLALALPAAPGALAADSYGIDSPSAEDVPRTVVSGGDGAITLNKVARVDHGERFVLRTVAPGDATYRVELRNVHGMVVDVSNRTLRGEDDTSFGTDYLQPGSYVAVLYDDGESKAALPVVVEGYDVTVDAPESVEAETDATVSATLIRSAAGPRLGGVELVVVASASGEVVVQRGMNGTTERGRFATTVRLSDPGTYRLAANVRGERSVRGYREVLGFSEPRSLSVVAPASPTDGGTDDATAAAEGAATSGTESSPAPTTVPEGVITRNATVGSATPLADSPTTVLSVFFALLLAGGLGLLVRARR